MSGNGKPSVGLGSIPELNAKRALRGVLAGKSKRQALIDAGYAESTASHKSGAILRRAQGELCQELERQGFGVEALADVLVKGCTTEDLKTVALFTRQVIAVCGDEAPLKHEVDVSGHITTEQVRKEQSRLEGALDSWLK